MRLNEIGTLNHLSKMLGISRNTLNELLNKEYRESLYNRFTIPKKDGSQRLICAPKNPLKGVQKRITKILWKELLWIRHDKETKYIEQNKMLKEEKQRFLTFAEVLEDYNSDNKIVLEIKKDHRFNDDIIQAFEKNKSILTNAAIHRNKKYILNVDLKDFFDCFTFYRVRGYFEKHKDFLLSKEIAMTLANLVCYQSKLPQGAPSSPILTNMIGRILDSRIIKLCKEYRLKYTRYADDLTFSTNDKVFYLRTDDFLHELDKIVKDTGFMINNKKTRISYSNSRQTVTGLVVNKRISVPREYYKATRGMAHQLYLDEKVYINKEEVTNPIERLSGRFAFINQVDKYNDSVAGIERKDFSAREKSFQRFIFYKNFYGTNKPMIVTEGKTDIRYLRASLKSLNEKFSKLIEIERDEKAEYNISFFKKKSVFEKYLGLNQHGGSIFEKIWNLYLDNQLDKNPNQNLNDIYSYFRRIGSKYKAPVIMIFDNELSKKDSPIYQFLYKYKKISKKIHEKEFEKKKSEKIQELKQERKTSEEIKIEIKKYEEEFCEDKKKDFESELKKQEWIHLKDNLYLMLIPVIDSSKDTHDVESLLLPEDIKKIDVKLGKEFNSSDKKFVEQKHYSKDRLSKQVMYEYKNISFQNFERIFENIESIVRDNKEKREK